MVSGWITKPHGASLIDRIMALIEGRKPWRNASDAMKDWIRARADLIPPPVSRDVPETIYKAVERVLDENSAWIARPDAEVTKRVAMAAGIAWQMHEPHAPPVSREAIDSTIRDWWQMTDGTLSALTNRIMALIEGRKP